jgi:hypothetical protein
MGEEGRLNLFVNRVLRRLFGHNGCKLIGNWLKLYNEELHNLRFSAHIFRINLSKRIRWTEHVPRMREKGNSYRILVVKPEGKRRLPRHRREDSIKRVLREIKRNSMD